MTADGLNQYLENGSPKDYAIMGLVVTGATLLVVYPLLQTIYTLHFGPLSHLSGPRLWAATRLPFLLSLMRGRITHDLAALHRRHGPIVRITPDEVSFTDPSAWSDILQPKPGGRHFTKHPSCPPGQEPVIRAYVDLLLTRLRGLAGAEVDVVPWFNYLTFDIVGDLGFGRSFGCLESSAYHAWIALILDTSKAIVFVGSARFYPYLFAALMWLVPEKALKAQREHTQYVVDCIERRLGMEGERPDMLGQVGLDVLGLSSLFQEVVIAGSETTAMALSAAVSLLVQDEEKMGVLVREVRGGTAVSIPIAAMHKSPASFHDSEGFHPERWLPEAATDPESPFYNDKRNASQPFILGPRQCIGINTAWMEMRLTMAKVLWTFDIAAPSDKSKLVKFDMLRSLMLLEKKPIPVMLKLREFKNG
ncbi:cytochrome P450 [Schizothecium vesticola]|uniref:Cytochrome P450 n=1 Tax=Schizothecium vesticola TaxID=314040 RepID=A0AA40BKP3_9PEZI|nr:cytochrome P450 [Schizothecium vesticola]